MTGVTNPLATPTPPASATPNSSSQSSATDPLASQDVFLQLLVAQLENQDPDSPADGTTFITQLAQFSELSNSTQMLSDLNAIQQSVATLAATPQTSGAATGPAGTSSPTSS
jgi:flagellar basal-body rod modification protein FlgD